MNIENHQSKNISLTQPEVTDLRDVRVIGRAKSVTLQLKDDWQVSGGGGGGRGVTLIIKSNCLYASM